MPRLPSHKENPMNLRSAALAMLVAAMCISAAEPKGEEKPAPDQQRMQGSWQMNTWIEGGQVHGIPEGARLVISEDVMVFGVLKEKKVVGMKLRYTIDSAKAPKEMDWIIEIKPGKSIKQLAIYSLENDTLKICMAPEGKPRPDEFKVGKGEARVLWTFTPVVDAPE